MARSIRFQVQPRGVPAAVAARRLGLLVEDFLTRLPALQREGFPSPIPGAENFDLVAIDAWLDRRAGLVAIDRSPSAGAIIKARLSAFDG